MLRGNDKKKTTCRVNLESIKITHNTMFFSLRLNVNKTNLQKILLSLHFTQSDQFPYRNGIRNVSNVKTATKH